jgi:hypothetical protein
MTTAKEFHELADKNRREAIDPVALEKAAIFGITDEEIDSMSKRDTTTGNSGSVKFCYYYLHTKQAVDAPELKG